MVDDVSLPESIVNHGESFRRHSQPWSTKVSQLLAQLTMVNQGQFVAKHSQPWLSRWHSQPWLSRYHSQPWLSR